MQEYEYRIWDRKEIINGKSVDSILNSLKDSMESPDEVIYLIVHTSSQSVVCIQNESRRPYKDLSIEECAQLDCDNWNNGSMDSP